MRNIVFRALFFSRDHFKSNHFVVSFLKDKRKKKFLGQCVRSVRVGERERDLKQGFLKGPDNAGLVQ